MWYEIGLIGFKRKQKYFGVNQVESWTYGSQKKPVPIEVIIARYSLTWGRTCMKTYWGETTRAI